MLLSETCISLVRKEDYNNVSINYAARCLSVHDNDLVHGATELLKMIDTAYSDDYRIVVTVYHDPVIPTTIRRLSPLNTIAVYDLYFDQAGDLVMCNEMFTDIEDPEYEVSYILKKV